MRSLQDQHEEALMCHIDGFDTQDFWSRVQALPCPACGHPMDQQPRSPSNKSAVTWLCDNGCGGRWTNSNPREAAEGLLGIAGLPADKVGLQEIAQEVAELNKSGPVWMPLERPKRVRVGGVYRGWLEIGGPSIRKVLSVFAGVRKDGNALHVVWQPDGQVPRIMLYESFIHWAKEEMVGAVSGMVDGG